MKGLAVGELFAILIFIIVLFAYFVIFYAPKKTTDISMIGMAFDQACKNGEYSINLSLGNKKKLTMDKGINQISINGDPDYLLYYEFFPPYDDVSWRYWIRDDMPAIVYAWLNDSTSKDIEGYRNKLTEMAKKHVNGKQIEVVFMNELDEGQKSMNRNEMIAEKHMACGDGMLCMKHGSTIRRYKLKECEKYGYHHIVVHYPYIFKIPLRSALTVKVFEPLANKLSGTDIFATSWFKYYPFYAASPCYNQPLIIRTSKCKCEEMNEKIYNREGKPVGEISWCDDFEIFGKHPQKDVKCLVVEYGKSKTPDYSKGFCYNNDLSNQVRYPDSIYAKLSKFITGLDAHSARQECIVPLDKNSVLFDPSCMDKMKIKYGIKHELLEKAKNFIIGVSEQQKSKFMSAWPIDVILV